ncbi:hypothetical protein BHS07_19505 [Myxococcus xanthus]|uniref:TIGR02265 family protein n=2 Tax=Myxococcaceae TaxID=31 RepID=A0AAE6KT10_MYXXA|nr:hypothetical protein BHS09_18845 [Myxococcus xanthus]QDE76149.1 hypothetical protein BHS08_18860 [Myxococcus xanthus]QDE83572.1 hypothetical protein BHS07_19505 [Myxococcus xanthus]QDE97697.1 hypothetical protein BHS05_18655 [Myxococcus xanthus]
MRQPRMSAPHRTSGAWLDPAGTAGAGMHPMAERLVFPPIVEGLFVRGLSGRVTPLLKEQLRSEGLDLDRPLLPAYSLESWIRCVTLTAKALHPHEPDEVAWRMLGERMIDGYRDTLMGRALLGVMKLLGPRRMLSKAQHGFRTSNNYTEVRITETGPTEAEVWLNEPGMLRYFKQGVMLAMSRAAGGVAASVDVRTFDEHCVTYRVSWKDSSR